MSPVTQYIFDGKRWQNEVHTTRRSSATTDTPHSAMPAPSPASSAGYTALTFGDEFDSLASVNTGTTANSTKKWSNYLPFDGAVMPSSCFTQGSWTDSRGVTSPSVLTIVQDRFNYNQGLYSVDGRNGAGFAQQYGYFEARICHPAQQIVGGDTMPSMSGGWPSWWSLAKRHIMYGTELKVGGTIDYLELDFHEYFTSAAQSATYGNRLIGTVHDWHNGQDWRNTDGHQYGDHMTGGPDVWHIYGCLWKPGSITWYLDGVQQHSISYSSNAAPSPNNSTSGYVMPSGTFQIADLDSQGVALVLGTGKGYPMHVDWVRVWGSATTRTPTLIPGNRLSLPDQSLEAGIGTWDKALGGEARTVSVSQSQAHDGTSSLRMVRTGAGTGWIATWGALSSAAPGEVFQPYAWIYTTTSGLSAGVNIEVKSNGAYVTGSYMAGIEVPIPVNTWTKVAAPAYTIPSGVNQFQPMLQIFGATTAGKGAYWDSIYFGHA